MAASAPAVLSGLANLLLRRPPSLRELVTLVGYADDYAWFAGLARRLFPQEAEAALSAPDVRTRVERFARLFGERHFPLYAPFFEFFMDEGDEPSLDMPPEGHPLRADGLRLRRPPRVVGRLPRGSLGPRSPGQAPRFLLRGTRRAPGGVAGVSRRAASRNRHWRGFPRAAYHWTTSPTRSGRPGSKGRRRPLPGSLPRPATSSWTTATTTACTTASPTRGRTTSSRRARRSGARPPPSWTRWRKLADWLEEDLPGRFAEMLEFVLGRLPNHEQEDNEHD